MVPARRPVSALTTRPARAGVSRVHPRDSCYPEVMTIMVRLSAWLLAAAVTFATLGPPRYRPHANLGQDGEHALAFVLIGLAFGLAYRQQRLLSAAIAVVLTGALELAQLWAPGRHARLEDFLVDALAACAGFVAAALLDWLVTRRSRPETA